MGFRVSSLGFWVLGFGFRVLEKRSTFFRGKRVYTQGVEKSLSSLISSESNNYTQSGEPPRARSDAQGTGPQASASDFGSPRAEGGAPGPSESCWITE